MNVFDVIIVQPIFNALLVLYGLTGDFGISILLFTILFRLAIWPLIKKQLHQTKLMRKVQPELKKIKARTKGNRALEAQLMMELYRERGIKPFSSIGVLLLQIPIFIGIYQVIIILTQHQDQIHRHVYEVTKQFPSVGQLLKDHGSFNENFLGFLNLTKAGIGGSEVYLPLILLAVVAAALQYVQTKQLAPQTESKKKLRDILKESSQGKQVDQSEISAIMGNRMVMFMPALLLVIALYLPGAVVLYYAMSSLVAVIQQHLVLSKDEEELLELADQPSKTKTKGKNNTTITRLKVATPAKVIAPNKPKKKRKKR